MSVNGTDTEETIWKFLCDAAFRGIETARKEMIMPTGHDNRIPMTQILQLFAGTNTPETVMSAATTKKQKFYALYYIGLYYEASKQNSLALDFISKSDALHLQDDYMANIASIHLRTLQREN